MTILTVLFGTRIADVKTIGVTGSTELLGRAICRELKLHKEYRVIPLASGETWPLEFSPGELSQCDWIIHAAIYAKDSVPGNVLSLNLQTARHLCGTCAASQAFPDIIYLSSAREGDDSEYGKTRAVVREELEMFGAQNHTSVVTVQIPNEFGPCGRPYYNSVVTTFCYELLEGKSPRILNDKELELIYVGTVAQQILTLLEGGASSKCVRMKATRNMMVSSLLQMLKDFYENYYKQGIIPALRDDFEISLFNTFRSYIDPGKFFPYSLIKHGDNRGSFVELVKQRGGSGQFSFSSTAECGVTRGEHFHSRKIERFIVIRGRAKMTIRAVDSEQIFEFELDGDQAAFVDVPIWFTHNLTNIGDGELLTAFWINEIYNPEDPDTYKEKV